MNAWEKLGKQMCYGDITINYQVRLTIGASNERDVLSVKQGHIVHKTAKTREENVVSYRVIYSFYSCLLNICCYKGRFNNAIKFTANI